MNELGNVTELLDIWKDGIIENPEPEYGYTEERLSNGVKLRFERDIELGNIYDIVNILRINYDKRTRYIFYHTEIKYDKSRNTYVVSGSETALKPFSLDIEFPLEYREFFHVILTENRNPYTDTPYSSELVPFRYWFHLELLKLHVKYGNIKELYDKRSVN
jgi:hypothetical protein